MPNERKRITVRPDSELGLLIKAAAASQEAMLVDTGEAVYSVEIAPTSAETEPARRAPQRVPSVDEITLSQEGIRKAAGSWKDVDVAEFKAYIAERRRASSRPPVVL